MCMFDFSTFFPVFYSLDVLKVNIVTDNAVSWYVYCTQSKWNHKIIQETKKTIIEVNTTQKK